MTFQSSAWSGMSAFKILGEVFDGATSKAAAAHLQINAHGTMDYINNSVRKFLKKLGVTALAMPGMLVGRILRSPHAHARIRSIDTSKAAALPGVKGAPRCNKKTVIY